MSKVKDIHEEIYMPLEQESQVPFPPGMSVCSKGARALPALTRSTSGIEEPGHPDEKRASVGKRRK